MELGMAQELYDELMELESKLRTIRYDTGPSLEDEVQTLQYKLAEYQLELETTLDNVRDVLRPSIEADIAATITAPSETPVDTDSQQMATNLSGDRGDYNEILMMFLYDRPLTNLRHYVIMVT